MENLKAFLKFLSGKKSTISGAIGLVIAYLAAKLVIGEAPANGFLLLYHVSGGDYYFKIGTTSGASDIWNRGLARLEEGYMLIPIKGGHFWSISGTNPTWFIPM